MKDNRHLIGKAPVFPGKRKAGDFRLKMRWVYVPYLRVSLLTVTGYTLFNWLFNIKLGAVPLKEDIINFFVPLFLSGVPVFIGLRKSIRILDVAGKRDSGHFLYGFLFWVFIMIPTVVLQDYVGKAAYDLAAVNSAGDVHLKQGEKYFHIPDFGLDFNRCASRPASRITGRHNETLHFYLYTVCPFSGGGDAVWYGVRHHDRMSSRESVEEKKQAYRNFLDKSSRQLGELDFFDVDYFERVEYSDDLDGYVDAIVSKGGAGADRPVVLLPRHGAFEDRLGDGLALAVLAYAVGALIVFGMVTVPRIKDSEFRAFMSGDSKKERELQQVLGMLNPFRRDRACIGILWLNVAVFIGMIFAGINPVSPTASELMAFGANHREVVLNGEPWRLMTSVFVHAGFMHLAVNMFCLFMAGAFLDKLLGMARLVMLYLFCGLAASLASIAWATVTSVGASGAILGLYGAILSFALTNVYPPAMKQYVLLCVFLYAGVGMVMGFLIGADNTVHLGGFLAGMLAGAVLSLWKGDELKTRAGVML